MDTMRGPFNEDPDAPDFDEDEVAVDVLPVAMGRDERRMQVHAYNHWASLLGTRDFPAIAQLDLTHLPEFAPCAVLIDFSGEAGAPHLAHIGKRLADQAGIDAGPRALSDVPSGTLLSRFTEHYAQIFANQAPIGFEAEFETPIGTTMLYRGILLPFSDDGTAITQILGVINWKEQLDSKASEGLMREMREVLEQPAPGVGTLAHPATPPGARARRWGWAGQSWAGQSWGDQAWGDQAWSDQAWSDQAGGDQAGGNGPGAEPVADHHLPVWPLGKRDVAADFVVGDVDTPWPSGPVPRFAPSLADRMTAARALALDARHAPPRDHGALYAAISAAHDLSLAADAAPEEAAALLAAQRVTPKPRAPYLPYVKLVFGADYDKTRLTEYATALAHARRIGLGRGALARHLLTMPGGLKAVVATQRLHRRADAPAAMVLPDVLAQALACLPAGDWDDVAQDGEIALVAVRRHHGRIEPLGKIRGNPALVERLLRQFLGEQGA